MTAIGMTWVFLFPYEAFKVRFFVFVSRRAVPLHMQSFLIETLRARYFTVRHVYAKQTLHQCCIYTSVVLKLKIDECV